MRMHWGGCACVLILAVLLPGPALGNGVYVPERAYPSMPEIPQQRAIIVYRDGVETLVVESAMRTQSPHIAWILPVPAVPTKLERGDPGEISSALFGVGPRIVHDLHRPWTLSLVALAVASLVALVAITHRDRRRRWARIRELLFVVLITTCLWAVLLPSLGGPGTPTVVPEGVAIQSAVRLGDAEFTTLSAKDSQALSRWLEEHSLAPLGRAAGEIVADYIGRGWCFVVGKLVAAPDAVNLPQPLVLTFPTPQPVFPMKLTALAGSTTRVELLVVGDQQAAAHGFHCSAVDRMELYPGQGTGGDANRSSALVGRESGIVVGSPDVVPRMWPWCIVTKLTADLAPAAMSSDVFLELKPFHKDHRDRFFTALSRRDITLTMFLAGLALWVLVLGYVGAGFRKPSPRQRRVLAVFLGVIALGSGITAMSLPTIPVHADRMSRHIRYSQMVEMPRAAQRLADKGVIRTAMKPAEMAVVPQRMVDEGLIEADLVVNPYTGLPMRLERSPGNFNIRTLNGKLLFCLYGPGGVEESTVIVLQEEVP